MAVVINYYNEDNEHRYECKAYGQDGLYIKAIKGNFYIFYLKKDIKTYIGKFADEKKTYKFLEILLRIACKRNVFDDYKYIKLCKRILRIF